MALPLPSKVVGTYFTLWGGGTRITSVPTTYNMIYLFHAVPVGTGAFRFEYGSAVSAAEIAACQARGQRVVLTVGGANAGFNFQTRAQSDAFVASFKQMNVDLGGKLDGCDFNNFEAKIGSSATEMTYIATQLKAFYGKDFSITCPPGPGAGFAPNDRVLTAAMAKAGVIDYAGPQFYDSSDLCQLGTITSLIDEWVANMGGDASKVVIGLSANYAGGPTLATSIAAWKQCSAKYPMLRGVFSWSAQDDAGADYSWGRAMQSIVGSSLVAGGTTQASATSPAQPASMVQAWSAGVIYKLGDVVTKSGKYFKLGQVGTNGSDGTDPEVSTWYWQITTAPTQAPVPAFKAGDVVKFVGMTGTVTKVTSAAITVAVIAKAADLTKV